MGDPYWDIKAVVATHPDNPEHAKQAFEVMRMKDRSRGRVAAFVLVAIIIGVLTYSAL